MSANHDSPIQSEAKGRAIHHEALLGITLVFAAIILSMVAFSRVAAKEIDSGPASNQEAIQTSLPLPTNRDDFFMPGTQPHGLDDEILDPISCSACHTDPGGLIYSAWRGSMMSQAGRDPVFWAAFAVAQDDATDAGEYCLRCHTPRGWYAGRSDPADGSALQPTDISAGLACVVCHRMVDPVAGSNDQATARDILVRSDLSTAGLMPPDDYFGSAMLIIDPKDNRRGPFNLGPNFNNHVAWQAEFQGQNDPLIASRLCGSCHNVDNPLLSWDETPPNGGEPQYWPNEFETAAGSYGRDELFPIERTYEEWLNSDYAKEGGVFAPQFAGAKPDPTVSSCQDCHMMRQTGVAVGFGNPTFRDCNSTGCLPAHIFAGGNAWVPNILQDSRWRLAAPTIEAPALNQTILSAQSMLARAATLEVDLEDGILSVRVINETGHKLPTGYPEGRRLWINVRAFDASNTLIYESGAYDESTGLLTKDADIKIYEAEQGLTSELAALVGMDPGATFHFALNNTTVKDNRIPPRGYTIAAFDRPGLRPVGAAYNDGQYWDDTNYDVSADAVYIVVTLFYQTSSREYIEFLRDKGGDDGQTLYNIWQDSKSPPQIVARAEIPAPYLNYFPMSSRP